MKLLHIGAGKAAKPEYWPDADETRLDVDPDSCPDILAPMTQIPVDDASFDIVYSSHTLEHVYYHEALIALREMHRVLKPGGACVAIVPDVEAVLSVVLERGLYAVLYEVEGVPICAADVLYGHQSSIALGELPAKYAHRFGYTKESLAHAFEVAGFGNVKSHAEELNVVAIGFK